MIEAYTVGTTLKLHDLVSAPLARIATQFEKLDVITAAVNRNLKAIGLETAGMRGLATAAANLDRHLAGANLQSANLTRNLAAVKALGLSTAGQAMPVLRYPNGVVYRGAQPVGGGHGGSVHMGQNGVGFSGASVGLGRAGLPLAGAAVGLYAAHGMYEAAKDYQTAQLRFKALNLGADADRDADKFARTSRGYGVSSTQSMETLRESVGIFGNLKTAKEVAPILAELNAANSAIFGKGKVGQLDEGAVRSIMRFNDMRGLTNNKEDFLRGLDLAQKMVAGSGGAIQFQDLEQLAKRGGTAFKGLSDEGVMMLGTVMQENGGAATGTALMSLYQNLISGRTTKKTMAALSDAGLAELGYVEHGKVGGKQYKTLQVTKVVDEEMLRTNPGAWMMKYGVEAAKKSGAKTDSEIAAFMNSIVSNRTGSNMATTFTTQNLQAMRDFELIKNAKGQQETRQMFKESAVGAETEFSAAWTDFKMELGKNILPELTSWLKSGADFLRSVSKFYDENREIFKMFETFGSLGGSFKLGKELLAKADGGSIIDSTKNLLFGGGNSKKQGDVFLDGKKVGVITAPHVTAVQTKEATRPTSGTRTSDPSMAPVPVGR